jgi:hypothetical protein
LIIALFILSAISGIFATLLGYFIAFTFQIDEIAGWIALSVLAYSFLNAYSKKARRRNVGGIVISVIIASLAISFASIPLILFIWNDAINILAVIGSAVFAGVVTIIVAATTAVTIAFTGIVAGTRAVRVMVIAGVTTAILSTVLLRNVIAVEYGINIAIPVAVITTLISANIGWRSFQGDERDTWVRSIAATLAAIRGGSSRSEN